jgi:hypothetical protein
MDKDELIIALSEMVQELTNKLINLRVDAGMKLKAKDAEIDRLKAEIAENQPKIINGGTGQTIHHSV